MMPDKEIRQIAKEALSEFKTTAKGCKPFSASAQSLTGASAAAVTKATTREAVGSVLKQLAKLKKGTWMSEPHLAEILPKDATEYTVEHGHVKLLFTHGCAPKTSQETLQVSCWYHPA